MVRLKACIDKFFCLRVTNNLQVKRKVTYIYIYIYRERERERERERQSWNFSALNFITMDHFGVRIRPYINWSAYTSQIILDGKCYKNLNFYKWSFSKMIWNLFISICSIVQWISSTSISMTHILKV